MTDVCPAGISEGAVSNPLEQLHECSRHGRIMLGFKALLGSRIMPATGSPAVVCISESISLLPEVHDCSAVLTGVRIGPGQEAAAAPAA